MKRRACGDVTSVAASGANFSHFYLKVPACDAVPDQNSFRLHCTLPCTELRLSSDFECAAYVALEAYNNRLSPSSLPGVSKPLPRTTLACSSYPSLTPVSLTVSKRSARIELQHHVEASDSCEHRQC